MFGLNHNVGLTLLMTTIYSVADSVWNGTVLVTYLYDVSGNSNAAVGYVEALSGMAMLFSAFPVGYFADKVSRSLAISFGGVVNAVAMALTAISVTDALHVDERTNFYILALGMIVYGIGGGVIQGPVQALYADSIATGERTRWYTILFVCMTLSSVLGPLVSIAAFLVYGNTWKTSQLVYVILVGLAMEIPAVVCLFLFKNSEALGEEAASHTEHVKQSAENKEMDGKESDVWVKPHMVPYILFANELVSSLASGVTIKFFPLYFKENRHMSPIQVQVIFALAPLSIALCSWGIEKVAKSRLGRIMSMVVANIVGVVCLVLMIVLEQHFHNVVICALYIVRTGLMNCTYPIQESVLMDYVPVSQRGRWKSLQSICAVGWCGSAMVGGMLADKHGYGFSFLFTAAFQLLAVVLYIPLLTVVGHERRLVEEVNEYDSRNADNEPLLSTRVIDE
ncbi:hypothetical protein SARC_10646 [Sphaeroforma arctica JP610]|uniref:Major facilitator superfamily (MFS) profile domain-containing protein n=1 Tax=Sphaeroforma arctica JP610 TaxID=667725 RepID=A0A0L0FJB5_9EUKA|nr:hypothetical protein SARC_10646 [Sphaeroforma arctica JP610]KNC76877.1 hypothetical protein SARC_10646 [Sphaeroforma arctica JP610]|eukprot:XP_014150779.1 hypothetical protein SARC_10646 [Sphaeroforma arctica JP610]